LGGLGQELSDRRAVHLEALEDIAVPPLSKMNQETARQLSEEQRLKLCLEFFDPDINDDLNFTQWESIVNGMNSRLGRVSINQVLADLTASRPDPEAKTSLLQNWDLPELIGYFGLKYAAITPVMADKHLLSPQLGKSAFLAAARPLMRNQQLATIYDTDQAATVIRETRKKSGLDEYAGWFETANLLVCSARFNPQAQPSFYQALLPDQAKLSAQDLETIIHQWPSFGRHYATAAHYDFSLDQPQKRLIRELQPPFLSSQQLAEKMGWVNDISFFLTRFSSLADEIPPDDANERKALQDAHRVFCSMTQSMNIAPPLEQRVQLIELGLKVDTLKQKGNRLVSIDKIESGWPLEYLSESWRETRCFIKYDESSRDRRYPSYYVDRPALEEYKAELSRSREIAAQMQAVIEGDNLATALTQTIEAIPDLPAVTEVTRLLEELAETQFSPKFTATPAYVPLHPLNPTVAHFADQLGLGMAAEEVALSAGIQDCLRSLPSHKERWPAQELIDLTEKLAEMTQAGQIPWNELIIFTQEGGYLAHPLNGFAEACQVMAIDDPEERKAYFQISVDQIRQFLAQADYLPPAIREPLSGYCTFLEQFGNTFDFAYQDKDRKFTLTATNDDLEKAGLNPAEIRVAAGILAQLQAWHSLVELVPGGSDYVFHDLIAADLVRASIEHIASLSTYRKIYLPLLYADPFTRRPFEGELVIHQGEIIVVMAPAGSGKSTIVKGIGDALQLAAGFLPPCARLTRLPTDEEGHLPVCFSVDRPQTTYEGSLFDHACRSLAETTKDILFDQSRKAAIFENLDEVLVGTNSRESALLSLAYALTMHRFYPQATIPIVDHDGEIIFRLLKALETAGGPELRLPRVRALTINPETHQPREGLAAGLGILTAQRVGVDPLIIQKARILEEQARAGLTDFSLAGVAEAQKPTEWRKLEETEPLLLVDEDSLEALDYDPTLKTEGYFTAVRDQLASALKLTPTAAGTLTRFYAQGFMQNCQEAMAVGIPQRNETRKRCLNLWQKQQQTYLEIVTRLGSQAQELLAFNYPSGAEEVLGLVQALSEKGLGQTTGLFDRIGSLEKYAKYFGLETADFKTQLTDLRRESPKISLAIIGLTHQRITHYVLDRLFDLGVNPEPKRQEILAGLEKGDFNALAASLKKERADQKTGFQEQLTGEDSLKESRLLALLREPAPANASELRTWLARFQRQLTGDQKAGLTGEMIIDRILAGSLAEAVPENLVPNLETVQNFLTQMTFGLVDAALLASSSKDYTDQPGQLTASAFPISFENGTDPGLRNHCRQEGKQYHTQTFQLPAEMADADVIILNGPNHSGKTELAKLIGQLLVQATTGSPVLAAEMKLGQAGGLVVAINPAEKWQTDSDFMSVCRRMERITQRVKQISASGRRPVVILDEPYTQIGAGDRGVLTAATLDEWVNRYGAKVIITNHEATVYDFTDGINHAQPGRINYLAVAMDRQTYEVRENGYGMRATSDPYEIFLGEFADLADRQRLPELAVIGQKTVELAQALDIFDQELVKKMQAAGAW